MQLPGRRRLKRLKKIFMHVIKEDMKGGRLNVKDAGDRVKWRRMHEKRIVLQKY